jgi:CheY-like chemotaxis protein
MKRILVADDDELILSLIGEALNAVGYEVIGVSSGVGVEKVLSGTPVDLLITDIFMPDREGIETIMMTRKGFPELPILAVSSDANYLRMAVKLGASDIIDKPVDVKKLQQQVAQLLA